MEELAAAFVGHARSLLKSDYLPKIERCLERLDRGGVWWRPNEAANSVGNLLLHLEGNARQWIVSGVGGREDVRKRDGEFAARAEDAPPVKDELLARLRRTLAGVDEVLAGLTPGRLLERRRIQGREGITVLEAVFHVAEHFSMHTGQIILLTKLRAASDLAFYDFSGGAPRPNWHE